MGEIVSKNQFFATAVLSLFVFVVSVISLVAQMRAEDVTCGCAVPTYIFIPFTAAIGLFTGLLFYQLYSDGSDGRKVREAVLKALGSDEEKVMEMVFGEGKVAQSELVSSTDLSKVKVSRLLKKMEQKGFVKKTEHGNTNMVEPGKKFEDVL